MITLFSWLIKHNFDRWTKQEKTIVIFYCMIIFCFLLELYYMLVNRFLRSFNLLDQYVLFANVVVLYSYHSFEDRSPYLIFYVDMNLFFPCFKNEAHYFLIVQTERRSSAGRPIKWKWSFMIERPCPVSFWSYFVRKKFQILSESAQAFWFEKIDQLFEHPDVTKIYRYVNICMKYMDSC